MIETASAWDGARAELAGLPGGRGLNIAHEAVDRHADGPLADVVAFRWLEREGGVREMTYADLRAETNRFAHVLRRLGVMAGERVFTLAGRIPEVHVTAFGALKNRNVFSPLFANFGPEPVRERLARGDAAVLVTTPSLYRRKVLPVRDQLPNLRHVLLAGADEPVEGTLGLDELLRDAPTRFEIPDTEPSDMALLHFTSGTTGAPKGAVHVHQAVVAHRATGRWALDLRPGDRFWCTADPAWVTGTSYGIITPSVCGVTTIVDEADLDAERWYRILQDERITVWYTAPTALRMLMRAGDDLPRRFDLSRLRLVGSVGEPLDPTTVRWTRDVLGHAVHDTWWQTETGGIMVANPPDAEVVPGSMGRPLPGVEVAVLERGPDGRAAVDDGRVTEISHPDVPGELALRPGWPSMFRGYLHDEERYERCFAGGWYLTGDVVRRDAQGLLWFVSRADDVIKSAGHLIGPFEVERVLMAHPAVVEAGVVGAPDPVAGQVVVAFVTLRPGHEPTGALALDIRGFARGKLGAAVAPRRIEFDQALPHTDSGKIIRRELLARLPEAVTS
jgi:acetyl-CoA synthetase